MRFRKGKSVGANSYVKLTSSKMLRLIIDVSNLFVQTRCLNISSDSQLQ